MSIDDTDSTYASPAIQFDAIVARVQTLVDGGLRITLDLPETAIPQAAWLMECKRQEVSLRVTAQYGQYGQ